MRLCERKDSKVAIVLYLLWFDGRIKQGLQSFSRGYSSR